jgi:anti-anti-sigma factor
MFGSPELFYPRWLGINTAGPDGVVIVKVQGEIDLLVAPGFSSRLTAACVRAPRHVLVDLSAVEFLGAAGIQALVDAHRFCLRRGIQFALLNPSPRVLRPLKLLGLDHSIPIHSPLYQHAEHTPA